MTPSIAARPSATMPITTRSARAASSGQPMTAAASATATGPRHKASASRPRPWRSEPSNRGCPVLTPADPSAGSGGDSPAAAHAHQDRTGQAGQSGRRRRADGAPQLHHRLVPHPRRARTSDRSVVGAGALRRPDQGVGKCLGVGGAQRPVLPAGQDPADVRVDHPHRPLERERQHGPRRVRTHAGERQQGVQVVRQGATVALDHGGGTPVQVDRPPVVAQPGPQPHHVAHGRGRAGGRRREPGQEAAPVRDHAVDARLLGHHLRDEDRPRVPGRPPRQVAEVPRAPGQHGRRPGSVR